jgi:hypothetical protein
MLVRVYWIGGLESGRLGIMPRPRGGDWLEDEIGSLKTSTVDVIVSLLERDEITELDIAEEESCCGVKGIRYLSFPIKDRNVPLSKRDAWNFARTLTDRLKDDKSVDTLPSGYWKVCADGGLRVDSERDVCRQGLCGN